MLIFKQMIILFLLMMVGYVCRKRGLLNDEGSKKISGLVVNVANPALVLSAGINPASRVEGRELLQTVGLAAAVYLYLIIAAQIIPRILKVDRKDRGVYRVMTIFSNIGFIGFPLIAAVYGKEAILHASVFSIPYNMLIYTYGISAMKPEVTGKEIPERKRIPWSKIFNVGVMACLLMIVLYLSGITVPYVVETTVTNLSNLTAPLSMIVIGDAMARRKWSSLFSDVKMLIFSFLKMLLLPLVGVFLLSLAVKDPVRMGVAMVMLATPVGSMTAMLAQQYDGNYELSSGAVALTTLESVITIPVVSVFMSLLCK